MISKPFQVYEWEGLSGSQVLSIYGHLDRVYDLEIDTQHPLNDPTGEIMQNLEYAEPILHFTMAFVGTWDTDLKKRSSIP